VVTSPFKTSLEPSIRSISFMFTCNLRLCSSRSCLCSRFACRKAFSIRSIALCVVNNQQSSGVIVVGSELDLVWSLDHERQVLHQSKLSYLSEDRITSTSLSMIFLFLSLSLDLFLVNFALFFLFII
jgi:hypothetical protein